MSEEKDISRRFRPRKRRVLVLHHFPNAGNHPPIYSPESAWGAARTMHEMMMTHGIVIVPPGYGFSVEEVDILPPNMDKPTIIFNDKPRK